jgi:eukaryotic-like serine/threonine-protein kinase
MSFAAGVRLGAYEIESLLGAGGMGEVYRARDTRLNRTVAIKVLSPALVSGPASLGRFRREAQAVAALQHSHVCVLHDVGCERPTSDPSADSDPVNFLVMEHLEGESLAHRLARGRPPIDETLRIASEIARGLAAVHRAGVVHRDLKPGNVMLTRGGAKLVDFGVAGLRPVVSGVGPAQGATATVTAPVSISGTLPYMAPEQLEGKDADPRSDIFAFGVMCHEMLTGRRPFDETSGAALIGSILERQPPRPSEQVDEIPPLLDRIVSKCLAKAPDERWQSADDLAEAIEWVRQGTQPPAAKLKARAAAWVIGAMAVLIAVISVVATVLWRPSAPASGSLRLAVTAPVGTSLVAIDVSEAPQFAMSPDGTKLALIAAARGDRPQLWIQSLESGASRPISGTDDATMPFWSPESESVAFFARGRLKRVRLDGAAPVDVAEVSLEVNGGTWNRDRTILFSGGTGGDGLRRVRAEGGGSSAETRLDPQRKELSHRWPQFLPDGQRYILYVRSQSPESSRIYLGSLGSDRRQLVLPSRVSAFFVPPDALLLEQSGSLSWQQFDPDAGPLKGRPQAIAGQITLVSGPNYLPISASATGRLAYWGGQRTETELLWFDREGRAIGRPLSPGRARYDNPELSPDNKQALVADWSLGRRDLYSIALDNGVPTKLTFAPAQGRAGIWSPDGASIGYNTLSAGVASIARKPSTGGGEETTITDFRDALAVFATDWSHDGNRIVYHLTTRTGGWDIGYVDVQNGAQRPIAAGAGNQVQGKLSPDGTLLAYASDESGTWEAYVSSLTSRRKWQVSLGGGGGTQPRWRRDGKELFYVALDGTLNAVPVSSGSGSLHIDGPTQRLFQMRAAPMLAPYRMKYAARSDGAQFLVSSAVVDAPPQTITVVDNWRSATIK